MGTHVNVAWLEASERTLSIFMNRDGLTIELRLMQYLLNSCPCYFDRVWVVLSKGEVHQSVFGQKINIKYWPSVQRPQSMEFVI